MNNSLSLEPPYTIPYLKIIQLGVLVGSIGALMLPRMFKK